jgi:hypothetical protein
MVSVGDYTLRTDKSKMRYLAFEGFMLYQGNSWEMIAYILVPVSPLYFVRIDNRL